MTSMDHTTDRVLPISRAFQMAAGWSLLAVVLVVPLLLDLGNLANTYYYPKARALYFLAPVMLAAVAARAAADPSSVDGQALRPALAFAVVASDATLTGVDPRWSLLGAPWRNEGLLTLLAYAVIFYASATALNPAWRRRWLAATLAGATLVALYGVAQYFGYEWLVLDRFRLGWMMAFSTTGNPNFLGAYMVLVLPMASAAILTARRPFTLALSVAALTVIYLAALYTFSRSAWASLALALGLFAALVVRFRGTLPVRRLVWTVILLTGLAAMFIMPDGPLTRPTDLGAPVAEARSAIGEVGSSSSSRAYVWPKTAELLARRPLLGYGPEALPRVFPQQWDEEKRRIFGPVPLTIDKAHNDTLDIAFSIGLLGLGAYWWLVVVALRRAWRAVRVGGPEQVLGMACVAGILGYWFDLQFQFSVVSVAPVFWSVLGVAAALGGGASRAGTQG